MTRMDKTVLLLQWWVCEGNAEQWYNLTGRDFNEEEFFTVLSFVINNIDGDRVNWSALNSPANDNTAALSVVDDNGPRVNSDLGDDI